MRKMNRLAALLAILMMSSTMAATTYADESAVATAATGTGSITVKNTVSGATYTVYKIFDATISGSGKDKAVSYTIPDGQTYDEINNYFTLSTNGGKTYVQKKSTVTDAALFNWLKGKGVEGDTQNGTGSDLTFTGLGYGYYYIKSSVEGGAATMISSATPDAVVQEKNGNPSWGDGSKTTDAETYRIGDTINYTVTYENALNFYTTKNDDDTYTAHKIYQYVLNDTMPEAVTLKTELGSFKVYVNNNAVTVGNTAHGSDAVVTIDKNNFTVTIPWAETKDPKTNGTEEDFYYDDVPATIKVTYQGVLTSDATLGSTIGEDDQKNTNRATINPNETTTDDGKKVEVYSGKITIDKVDANEETKKLEGAKFKVIDKANKDADDVKYLKYDGTANGGKGAFTWLEKKDAADATVYTTDVNGAAEISGLAAGTYYLLEIEAPQGYNVLTDAQPVTLTKGVDDDKVDHLLMTAQVANNKGTLLPSTGGMGTVAFAVVGLIVMAGAAITLIIKKRA
mgnify:CR=1 FL=1